MVKKYLILLFGFINIILPCAVCYGALDDPMTKGMNNAILFLLSIIGFLLISIIATTFYFNYRAKTLK